MKNWLCFVYGELEHSSSHPTGRWVEKGIVNVDPATVVAILEETNLPGFCNVIIPGAVFVVKKSREHVISLVQSALP